MLLQILATTALLFSPSALAAPAPTRTHCRCTVVADPAPAAIFSPAVAHWTPAEPSSSPPAFEDPCANLGPELENFSHEESEFYVASSTRGAFEHGSRNQRPMSRDVLLSARREAQENEGARGTTRPRQRIVCRSERDQFSEYQGSFVTLWILHVIVAVAILACIAEGVHLSLLRWYGRSDDAAEGVMRLQISSVEVEGGEKRAWAQQTTPMLIVQAPNGDRVCIRYEEDLDDEMYRPVM